MPSSGVASKVAAAREPGFVFSLVHARVFIVLVAPRSGQTSTGICDALVAVVYEGVSVRSRVRALTVVVFAAILVGLACSDAGAATRSSWALKAPRAAVRSRSVPAEIDRTSPKPGDEPSTARIAVPGRTYHADTGSQTPDASRYYNALWKVWLPRRTDVTISWSQPPAGRIQLNVLPGCITNRTWANQEPLLSSNTGSSGRVAFVFIAAVAGWYYLDFGVSASPGRYTFSLSRPRRDCHDFGC